MPDTRTASCNCGAIRIEARGPPLRIGLCHCTTCRKESGAPYTANAIWAADHVTISGDTASWKDTTDARHFCPSCGSALFGVSDSTGEIEIRLGAIDAAPTDLAPTYELWTERRENWLPPLSGADQFVKTRDDGGPRQDNTPAAAVIEPSTIAFGIRPVRLVTTHRNGAMCIASSGWRCLWLGLSPVALMRAPPAYCDRCGVSQ